jgi:hypothetical protein
MVCFLFDSFCLFFLFRPNELNRQKKTALSINEKTACHFPQAGKSRAAIRALRAIVARKVSAIGRSAYEQANHGYRDQQ